MIKDGHEFFDQKYLANCFRKFFVIIGRSLSSIIPESQSKFELYLNPHQTFMGEANLTDVELKETLRSLKHNKVSGYFFQCGKRNFRYNLHHLQTYFQPFVTTGNIFEKLKNCKSIPNF